MTQSIHTLKQHKRTGLWVDDNGYVYGRRSGKELKEQYNIDGYPRIAAYEGEKGKKKRKWYFIHHVVFFTFNTAVRLERSSFEIDHINRNRKDNRLVNLRAISKQENLARRQFGEKKNEKK